MKAAFALILFSLAASNADAQKTMMLSGGEVARAGDRSADAERLASRIPGVDAGLRARVHIGGDSAQRIAIRDFEWRGRVASVEFDEEDDRVFWDVKIVPDTSARTIVRYRVDAATGGILGIKEFGGVAGLARPSSRKP